jgi:hypothetical protein
MEDAMPSRIIPMSGSSETEAIEASMCPDCDSQVVIVGPDEDKFFDAIVSHDETCPFYRALG